MTRRSILLLLFVATVASADNIRFSPPSPDSQTRVLAYVHGTGPCVPQTATAVVDVSTISIKLVVPCLLPGGNWSVPVDLGVLPSGIYFLTATINGGLLAQTTLVVRDASPPFESIPNVTYSGAPENIRLSGKNLALCASASQCASPTVKFGATVAEVLSASADEIIVRAPMHDSGPVDVTIERGDATLRTVAAFYYIPVSAEPPNPAFYEPVLFPVIFTGLGAFGSRWDTVVVFRNENDYPLTLQAGSIFTVLCFPGCDSRPQAHSTLKLNGVVYPTGYVQLVPRQAASRLHFGVLVRDLSRQAEALGTEIPVIRENEFFDRPFELLNVPTDSRFRVALRLYSFEGGNRTFFSALPVAIWSSDSDQLLVSTNIVLLGNLGYVSMPGYAQISDLVTAYPELAGKGPLRIQIGEIAKGSATFWGFVTVTNNDTQHVTTITPQ